MNQISTCAGRCLRRCYSGAYLAPEQGLTQRHILILRFIPYSWWVLSIFFLPPKKCDILHTLAMDLDGLHYSENGTY